MCSLFVHEKPAPFLKGQDTWLERCLQDRISASFHGERCIFCSGYLSGSATKNGTFHNSNLKFVLKTSHIPFVLLEISLNPSRLTSPCSLSKMSAYSKESLIKGASYWNSTAVDSPSVPFRKPTPLRSKQDSQRIYPCSLLLLLMSLSPTFLQSKHFII